MIESSEFLFSLLHKFNETIADYDKIPKHKCEKRYKICHNCSLLEILRTVENEEKVLNNSEKKIIKEEVSVQLPWSLFSFFLIYFVSYLLPGILFMTYVLLFFLPYFLETSSFIALFTELYPLLAMFTMPLVMIACYVLHLFFVSLITRWFWHLTEKKSPSKDGIIPRNFRSKTLNYYHIRSFLIKYPKNLFVKGPFPWLANWMFNFVGTNKIGKGTTIEEQVVGDKFCDIGNNCYVGANSSLASHLVEGIFGNVIYFKIKLEDNSTLAASNTIAPGCEFGRNSYLLPTAATSKYNKAKGNNYYFGMPLRKIFKRKIMEYLQISEEDLKRDEELRKKQQKLKIDLK